MENKYISNSSNFNDLSDYIHNEYIGILCAINEGVNNLFYEVGDTINKQLQFSNYNNPQKETIIGIVANGLQSIFGDFFSHEQLILMCKLAEKCKNESFLSAISIINLEYIPYLLNLDNEKEWVFYAQLIYKESLTPIELGKRVYFRAYEKENNELNTDINSYFNLTAGSFYHITYNLYFGKENKCNFQKLFEPQSINNLSFQLQVENELIDKIYKKIKKFQSEYNHLLNVQYNILFWELGVKMTQMLHLTKTRSKSKLIDFCIRQGERKNPSIFNVEELNNCFKFVEKYGVNNIPPIAEIIQTVSWPYIKVLLDIDDVDKQKYIASYVLKNGITIERLIEMINNGYFDFELTYEHLQEIKVNKTVESTMTIENNFTVTGTMETIESKIHPDHDLNRNIFKNPDLLKFLQENYLNN